MNKTASQASTAQVRQPVSAAEARERAELDHWLAVGNQVNDPTMARLIIELFDVSPQLCAQHPGLYLSARKAVQLDRIRYAKAQRRAESVAKALLSLGKLATVVADGLRAGAATLIAAMSDLRKKRDTADAAALPEAVPVDEASVRPATPVPAVEPTMSFPPIVDPFLH